MLILSPVAWPLAFILDKAWGPMPPAVFPILESPWNTASACSNDPGAEPSTATVAPGADPGAGGWQHLLARGAEAPHPDPRGEPGAPGGERPDT